MDAGVGRERGKYQNSSKFTEPERSVSNILRWSGGCWKKQPRQDTYLIIMRTVCGSKGDQSPFTSAVRSSASVRLPLPAFV